MSRSDDPLALSPHWHVDYRIEAELPEDTVVSTRFLLNLAFTIPVLVALLVAAQVGAVTWSLHRQIGDWERRLKENRNEIIQIDRLQREFAVGAAKIDHAYVLLRPRLYVSGFLASLGRTRPEEASIDAIEWNEGGIVVRGGLRERSERASRILGAYIDVLRKDEQIGPHFQKIVLTDVDRGSGADATLRFEIKFTLKDGK